MSYSLVSIVEIRITTPSLVLEWNMNTFHSVGKLSLFASLSVIVLLSFSGSVVATSPSPGQGWTVMNRNYNGNGSSLNLQATHAYVQGSDIADFDFLQTTNGYTAYLWYTGNTAFTASTVLTATFSVTGSGAFTAYPSGTAQVRLYFQSNLPSNKGGTACLPPGYGDNFWWSEYQVSAITNGQTVTLTTNLNPTNWHGVCGQNGADDPNFNSALSSVVEYGFSFGSPNAWASGVGLTGGSSTFNLISYTVS